MLGNNLNLYQLERSDIKKASAVLANSFKNDPVWKDLLTNFNQNQIEYFFESPVKYCLTFGAVYAPSNNIEGVIAFTKNKNANISVCKTIISGTFLWFLDVSCG